ncbi:MAG: recombinase family protein [Defluviitaleaceae bacterium]|nr:recombinase family protein [Defluviitaleaceae bacterium]
MNAALYLRLSKDDKKDFEKDESESITNQRKFLVKHAKENNINIVEIYADDGYSGTNSNRPAFQKMINDIEKKKIDTIIVKDLSRLFRDYIQTGYYLEKFFPEKGIRFIAILDGIDTVNEQINDLTPFKALMVDWYAKDVSRKIKQVKRDKIKKGEFIGPKAPFGYKKDEQNKNKLLIDDVESIIVKDIFKRALAGESTRQIAFSLTKESIKTPGLSSHWYAETVSSILQNEVYIGNMVQGRVKKPSYKSKKVVKLKKEDWIIVENTHEPIIDKETFERVGEFLKKRQTIKTRTLEYPLKGIVFCVDCKKAMGLVPKKNIYYLRCRTYAKYTKLGLCTPHSIRADFVLEAAKNAVVNFFKENITEEELLPFAIVRMDSEKLKEKLKKLQSQIKDIYNDKLNGLIEEGDFKIFYNGKKEEESSLKFEIAALETTNIEEKAQALISDFLNVNIYEKLILSEFIESVEIGEGKKVFVNLKKS